MSSKIFEKFIKRPSSLIIISILLVVLFGFIFKHEGKRISLTFGNHMETDGVVTSLRKTNHSWSVHYNYSVDNKSYKNTQTLLLVGFNSDFASGKKIIVKYDTLDPNISIIKSTELQLYIKAILVFLGVLLVLKALLRLIKRGIK